MFMKERVKYYNVHVPQSMVNNYMLYYNQSKRQEVFAKNFTYSNNIITLKL